LLSRLNVSVKTGIPSNILAFSVKLGRMAFFLKNHFSCANVFPYTIHPKNKLFVIQNFIREQVMAKFY
jgi:hypothetical protein